ncbi:MAG: hypothetical protein ACI396_04810, partial [Acutalibacteraceae bacterium]
ILSFGRGTDLMYNQCRERLVSGDSPPFFSKKVTEQRFTVCRKKTGYCRNGNNPFYYTLFGYQIPLYLMRVQRSI